MSTRDLHDRDLDSAAAASLGTGTSARRDCVFCSLPGDYAVKGRFVCQDCAGELFRAYRRNKQLREAGEHGVFGVGSMELRRAAEFGRRRA